MQKYRMDIEYDGTRYAGWQVQDNETTIQGEIEKALSTILKDKIKVIGAGRTDAGVHALGQVAHFTGPAEVNNGKLLRSLNAIVGECISVKSIVQVPDHFNARYSALYREYEYRISSMKRAIRRHYIWQFGFDVNWEKVGRLTNQFKGKHDFSAFCSTNSDAKSKICDIHSFYLEESENEFVFHIRANRFLYKMVRSIVGTLVDIGRGYLDEGTIQKVLKSGNRQLVGDTAPAHGLTLIEVGYTE